MNVSAHIQALQFLTLIDVSGRYIGSSVKRMAILLSQMLAKDTTDRPIFAITQKLFECNDVGLTRPADNLTRRIVALVRRNSTTDIEREALTNDSIPMSRSRIAKLPVFVNRDNMQKVRENPSMVSTNCWYSSSNS